MPSFGCPAETPPSILAPVAGAGSIPSADAEATQRFDHRRTVEASPDARMIADIRRQLRRMISPDLARLTGPAKAIIDAMNGTDASQNGERFKLGEILVKGQDAVERGYYLAWCRTLGLHPRTAQNYTLMWRTLGSRFEAFCGLKTTVIYQLARSSGDVVAAALDAVKDGQLTAQAASKLLATQKGGTASKTASPHLERALAIIGMLDADVRAELVALLPRIDLAEVRGRLTPQGHPRPAIASRS